MHSVLPPVSHWGAASPQHLVLCLGWPAEVSARLRSLGHRSCLPSWLIKCNAWSWSFKRSCFSWKRELSVLLYATVPGLWSLAGVMRSMRSVAEEWLDALMQRSVKQSGINIPAYILFRCFKTPPFAALRRVGCLVRALCIFISSLHEIKIIYTW